MKSEKLKPEEFLNRLKEARVEGKELIFFHHYDGTYSMNKISSLGDLKRAEIKKTFVLFKGKYGHQYYNMDLITEVYAADKMI